MPLTLQTLQRFGGTVTAVEWRGVELLDGDECSTYLSGPVAGRVRDTQAIDDLVRDLQGLATTSMQAEMIEKLLATEGPREAWEVGEAMAECLLEDELGVVWPWNMNRDRRTPRASLPGADLVGFVNRGSGAELAFGEVKTSFDEETPPGVMTGRTGMIHQLEELATNREHHFTLLKWLHARCKGTPLWPSFVEASHRYIQSDGGALFLCGVLMRDTTPSELDLKNRAIAVSAKVNAPAAVHLTAWYVPLKIDTWCHTAGVAA